MNLDRSIKLIGKNNVKKLNNLKVLIVGLGGVGGMTLEMLVRSGIENLIIIDYDDFEESNINRQLLCTQKSIEKHKTDEAIIRVKSINPLCSIKKYDVKINRDFLCENNLKVDYIIDACDDVNAKIELIKYALDKNIKIVSCMGTGNKLDPAKLKITNIWKTQYDPLAKKIRQYLRKENITDKIPVVTSEERPLVKSIKEIPSLALVPNAAGILLASYVINDIIKIC